MFKYKSDKPDEPIKVDHEGFTGDMATNACLEAGVIQPANLNAQDLPYWPFNTVIGARNKDTGSVKVGVVKTTGNN